MIITAITPQKKRENRYNIFIDNAFAFGIDGVDMLYYKLKPGMELSQQRYDEILEQLIFIKAREKALNYIDYKQRTKKEVMQKLSDEYSSEIVERVIDLLEKYKIIDDTAYAQHFVRDCLNLKGWGRQRILQELYRRGIDKETAFPFLENTSEIMQQKADRLIEKCLKGQKFLDSKEYKKHYDFLLRRGFDFATAKNALEKFRADDDF